MMAELFGLFSPALSQGEDEDTVEQRHDRRQLGIPPTIQSFSQQIRFLNETLMLPHKENGQVSELAFSDTLYVCKVNSDDHIKVTDRVVLFPPKNKTDLFPLLMSERTAREKIESLFQQTLNHVYDNESEMNVSNVEERADYISMFDVFDINDKLETVGTYISLLAITEKLKGTLVEKTKQWLIVNQEHLSSDTIDRINRTIDSATRNTSPANDRVSKEYCQVMIHHFIRDLANIYEMLHLKPIGVVVCLIETDRNYATSGDFVQVKLHIL